jgi:GntR family transcriptional regulator
VASGARRRLLAQRRERFAAHYVEPLVTEAVRLGIDTDELIALVRESSHTLPVTSPGGVTV